MSERYILQRPYIGNDGIYVPVNEYVPDGTASTYRCVISKKLFVEAYNKWIKCEENNQYSGCGDDDADCWCE